MKHLHNKFNRTIGSIALCCLALACQPNKSEKQPVNKADTAAQNYKPKVLKDTVGGIYHEYYSNGKVKLRGVYKNGKRDGDWNYFYENGNLWSMGEYTNGVRNGLSNVFYQNGVLRMEGNYRNNKRSGVWKFYNESGKLIKEVNFN
jgi:hypothetical protein